MSNRVAQPFVTHLIWLILFFAILLLVTACQPDLSGSVRKLALGQGSIIKPWVVTIEFNPGNHCLITGTKRDPTKCTKGKGFCVKRAESIEWRSKPENIGYELFFDPIQGQPLKSDGHGVLRRKIDPDAPIANYKYSIVGEGCAPDGTNTHDPHIRVDK